MKIKKHLTEQQEFEIMKLVLDKFLWLGFGVLVYGLYQSVAVSLEAGVYWLIAGIILLIAFMWVIVKEYEVLAR